ncbi:MAG: winged helix-turn-helix domain-containing protein [Candidatus Micrarchaeota archaeon]
MDSKTRLLYWLLSASRGGPTRVRILHAVSEKPANMRRLSVSLGLDYKTVQGHVEILVENGILETPQKKYGSVYFISAEWADNAYLAELLKGEENEK